MFVCLFVCSIVCLFVCFPQWLGEWRNSFLLEFFAFLKHRLFFTCMVINSCFSVHSSDHEKYEWFTIEQQIKVSVPNKEKLCHHLVLSFKTLIFLSVRLSPV